MRVGIFTSNQSFIEPVMRALQKRGHETPMWAHTGDELTNRINLMRLMDSCDVAFFDWVQTPFLEAMSLENPKCKIAARAHGMEFFSIYDKFPWQYVDLLVGASEIIGQALQKVPVDHRPKRYVDVPVGSDPTLFTIPKNKRYGHSLITHSTTIRYRKRVYTTLQSFYDLLQHDRKWDLHIVGEWERGYEGWEGPQYTGPCQELIEDLELATKIHTQPNMDPERWRYYLSDMDLFISNSIREGVQVSLVESMMSGVWPLINCWRGAGGYYPGKCIFKTQRELVDKVLEWGNLLETDKMALSQEAREWAVERFDNDVLMGKLVEELEAL